MAQKFAVRRCAFLERAWRRGDASDRSAERQQIAMNALFFVVVVGFFSPSLIDSSTAALFLKIAPRPAGATRSGTDRVHARKCDES